MNALEYLMKKGLFHKSKTYGRGSYEDKEGFQIEDEIIKELKKFIKKR